jgi:hypothetical protein
LFRIKMKVNNMLTNEIDLRKLVIRSYHVDKVEFAEKSKN